MSDSNLSGGSNPDINIADVVEHIMNTNVFGVVIGFQGSLVGIRVSPSLATLWFHEWELRHMNDDGEPVPDGGQEEVEPEDNVINLATVRAANRRAA